MTADQVTELLESVSGDEPLDRRDRAMLELLYGTGIRIAELVGIPIGTVMSRLYAARRKLAAALEEQS